MHTEIRIEYDSYVPASAESPPISKSERHAANLLARAGHLCSLGFVLSHFNPHNLPIDDDVKTSLNNYGRLIRGIAEGLYHETDEMESLLEAATTFAETGDIC